MAFLGGLAVATFSEYRELFPFLLRGTLFAVQIALLSALLVCAIVFIVRAGRQDALHPARLLAEFSKLARSAQRLRESESFTVAGRAAVIAALVAFLAGLSVATRSPKAADGHTVPWGAGTSGTTGTAVPGWLPIVVMTFV